MIEALKRHLKRLLSATGMRQSGWERWKQVDPLVAVPVPEPRDVTGHLQVWVEDAQGVPVRMQGVWVPGPDYGGMENNDLRGYLDGRFQHPWNQVSQAHVRVGRLGDWVELGEYELFRVLHRWSGIELPPGARVLTAALTLTVEKGPPVPLRVKVYEVKRDWEPGSGGRLRDNVSPPAPGEVWWNQAKHESEAWALPGAGYAHPEDPEADTFAEPLAEVEYAPGQARLRFSSPAFADACGRSLTVGEPLRLLIKLSDAQEDVPGTVLTLYGAHQGDDRTLDRRPRLALEWEAPGTLLRSGPVSLEHGRSLPLAPIATPQPGWRWVGFTAADGSSEPLLERLGPGEEWLPVQRPFRSTDPVLDLRMRAMTHPVEWGKPFTAQFRDTWIRSAPPAAQRVPWTFTSPTGERHQVLASFEGEATWRVSFVADEVGSWRYAWSHELSESPYRSAEGSFDVIVGTLEQATAALTDMIARAERMGVRRHPVRGRRLLVAFSRLERAILALATPTSWRGEEFAGIRALLDQAREALWGAAVPEPLPMNACPPPTWATPGAEAPPSHRPT